MGNVNTHVAGSGTVYVNSGNDTNLRGATVSGETVIADVGGDLNIESQLDTATANAKQVGASIGVGSNPAGLTGGLSGSYQTAKGDAVIVSEQSGIHAGEGGFDIKVDGNTKLKGGLITSEADPKDNRLETGTLEFEDLDTHSKWKADTYGGGITGSGPIVSPPIKEGESETGKALSAISPGEIVITDPDNQKQNIDDLRRDTADTNTSLPGIPDLQKLLSEQLKTQQLYDDAAAKAAKMIGDYASERYRQARENDDKTEMEFWKEGGNGPAILHAIAGGLLGGVTDFNGMLSGMLGGAMSAKLAPEIHKLVEQFVKDAGLTGAAADLMVNSITGSILQGLGAATGGTGAAYAGNGFQYNYLGLHDIEAYKKALAKCETSSDYKSCAQQVWTEGGFDEIYRSNQAEFLECLDTNSYACVDQHVNAILEARTAASSLRQDMVERMPPNTINQPNAYALDALRSYYGLDNVSEIVTFRDVFCGGMTSDACRAQSKQIAELRNQDALRNLGVFTLASMIGLTVTTEVAAACLASTTCIAAFTMADTAVALQACAGGDVTSCGVVNRLGPKDEVLGGVPVPNTVPPKVPGRVQSRVNLANGDSSSGWTHVVDRHFNPERNASQFTISQSDLRTMLQSPQVVKTPITRTMESAGHGTLYVREVDLGRPIGTDKFNNFQPTSTMTVMTDRFGNLVTATPGVVR
ncbi:hemagglutinin repeat-containing protein [Brucella intermedia]|uniref:hemagglutinin repeat-containing protein n=1 Tax=Brucella intermedia TaxID=94625 RepID=UPI00224AF384|nr:hemagglutinin repeat-containing protein [Brucella intermedia]